MDNIERGAIFCIKPSNDVQGSEQDTGRPCIVVSNNKCNLNSSCITIVPLTTAPKRDLPTHCTIRSSGKISTALCEQVRTISVERISDFEEGRCTTEEMRQVDACLMIQLGLSYEVRNTAERKDPPAPLAPDPIKPAPHSWQISPEDYARAVTERDTYKNMFQDLLARIIK